MKKLFLPHGYRGTKARKEKDFFPKTKPFNPPFSLCPWCPGVLADGVDNFRLGLAVKL